MRWLAATLGAIVIAVATFVGVSALDDTARAADDDVLARLLDELDLDVAVVVQRQLVVRIDRETVNVVRTVADVEIANDDCGFGG